MKLGKLPPRMHAKTLSIEKYLGDALPVAPSKVYWSYKVPADAWGMLGNDVKGDCVVAMAMHMDMNWTAHTGKMRQWTTEQAVEIYDRLSPNDEGLVMTDFLNFWQTEGMFGNKILGWASFNYAVPNRFNQVDWLFGSVACGVQFPRSAMNQFEAGQTWTVVQGRSPIDGGHAVPAFNFGALGDKVVTWAKLHAMVNAWRDTYLDEAYAVISESWFDTVDVAPNHLQKDALWADLKKL